MRAVLENTKDFGIHFNKAVLLLKQLLVSSRNLTLNPLFERNTSDCEDNVDHELPGELRNLLLEWQMLFHLRVSIGELQYVGGGKAFELRNI